MSSGRSPIPSSSQDRPNALAKSCRLPHAIVNYATLANNCLTILHREIRRIDHWGWHAAPLRSPCRNMATAVSRLDFGPKLKTMEVTDIRTGHFVFTPVADERVSLRDLERSIEKAGYEVEKVTMTVTGVIDDERNLEVAGGQVFRLANRGEYLDLAAPGVRMLHAKAGGGYAASSGTSFAVPFAATAAARIRSLHPNEDALKILYQNAEDLGAPGRDEVYGYGLLRPDNAIPSGAQTASR